MLYVYIPTYASPMTCKYRIKMFLFYTVVPGFTENTSQEVHIVTIRRRYIARFVSIRMKKKD